MAKILLIHGAAHGAWCWRDTIPALAAFGHDATAIDLPGHGQDPTPIEDVTLDDYARAILDAIDGPTVLLGHSMGGYPITRAAEIDPANIAHLVFLCAYTPWPGLSLSQMRMQAEEQPLLPAIRLSEDRRSFSFDPDMAPDKFYNDCPPEAVADALRHLCPESIAASATPVTLTERSQAKPRSYITCARDQAIPPQFQRVMAQRFEPTRTREIDSSHSPFLSMPRTLAATIDSLLKD